MRKEAAAWLRQSRTDLRTSERLLVDDIYYASVFFAQQAAEKALKAMWIAVNGELPPKTHNLVALARELGAAAELAEAAAELTPEYILTRYPSPEVALPEDLYSKRSAEAHLEAARSILLWVEQGLRAT